MADEKRYFWLKLNQDFFDSKRIKKLRKMAGGDTYTIIYLKLQLLALNTDGVITWTGLEADVADELALDLDESPEDIKVTLSYMLHCGLAETSDNVNFFLPYVIINTGSEGSSAKRKREQRAREKALVGEKRDNVTQLSAQCPQMSGNCHGEKDKEKRERGRYREYVSTGARARESDAVENSSFVENSVENSKDDNFEVIEQTDTEDEDDLGYFSFDEEEETNSDDRGKQIPAEDRDKQTETDGRADKRDELKFIGGEIGQGVLLLSDRQMEELIDKMGLVAFNEYARRVSDYIINKDAKITSCYATVLKWWKEDMERGKYRV